MNIKYQVFEVEGLLIQRFAGFFDIQQYIRYSKFVMQNINSDVVHKVLIDFRGLTFDELEDNFNEVIEKVASVRKNIAKKSIRKEIQLVFWVDKPIPTAVLHLFIENMPEMNYQYNSTEETVWSSLKLAEDFRDLDKIVKNLGNAYP